MKRYDNLYERICSIENLRLAEKRARKGKDGTYGVRCLTVTLSKICGGCMTR